MKVNFFFFIISIYCHCRFLIQTPFYVNVNAPYLRIVFHLDELFDHFRPVRSPVLHYAPENSIHCRRSSAPSALLPSSARLFTSRVHAADWLFRTVDLYRGLLLVAVDLNSSRASSADDDALTRGALPRVRTRSRDTAHSSCIRIIGTIDHLLLPDFHSERVKFAR